MTWTQFPVEPGDVLNSADGPRAELLLAFEERAAAIRVQGRVDDYVDPNYVISDLIACNDGSRDTPGGWGNDFFGIQGFFATAFVRSFWNHDERPGGPSGTTRDARFEPNPLWPTTTNQQFLQLANLEDRFLMSWTGDVSKVNEDFPGYYTGHEDLQVMHVAGVDEPSNARVFRDVILFPTMPALDMSKVPVDTVAERLAGERLYRKWDGSSWVKDASLTEPTVLRYSPDFTIDAGGGYGSASPGRFVVTCDSLNRAKALINACRWPYVKFNADINDLDHYIQFGRFGASEFTGSWGGPFDSEGTAIEYGTYAAAQTATDSDHAANANDPSSVVIYYPRIFGFGKGAAVLMGFTDGADPNALTEYDAWSLRVRTVKKVQHIRIDFVGSGDAEVYAEGRPPIIVGGQGDFSAADLGQGSAVEYDNILIDSFATADANEWRTFDPNDTVTWYPERSDLPAYDPNTSYTIQVGYDLRFPAVFYKLDGLGGFSFVD